MIKGGKRIMAGKPQEVEEGIIRALRRTVNSKWDSSLFRLNKSYLFWFDDLTKRTCNKEKRSGEKPEVGVKVNFAGETLIIQVLPKS
jgi:hypothetical protein